MPFQEIKNSSPEIKMPVEPLEPETPKAPKAKPNMQKIFRRMPEFDESTQFHQGPRSGGKGHVLVAWSFVAALIDALILFATSCFFLFGLSLLVKIRFVSFSQVFGESIFQVGIISGVFLLSTYMIMLRVFLGFTIGEWACGLRLGSLKQRLNKFYSLKVIARQLLICVTGLFLLPFLSMIIGRDIPGLLVRLPLVQQSSK